MATRILDLQPLTSSLTVATNEDWLASLGAWVDGSTSAIPLDGITLNFQMRQQAGGFAAPLNASTAATLNSMPLTGTLSIADNAVSIDVPLAAMLRVTPGPYSAELQAVADGLTRTIGRYSVTVLEGVLR